MKRRISVIFNPEAGTGRFEISGEDLVRMIKQAGAVLNKDLEVTLHQTKGKGDASIIASRAVLEGAHVVVASGGDGTIMEVANSLAGTTSSLGIIPLGTGNDTLMSMAGHCDRGRCVREIVAGEPMNMDLGSMNGHYFVNVVGLGLDAAINHETAKRRELVKKIGPTGVYVLSAIKVITRYSSTEVEIHMDDKKPEKGGVYMFTVGNGTTCGGGFRLTPNAVMDDGMLDISMVRPMNPVKALMNIPYAYRGTHLKRKETSYHQVKEITVTSTGGKIPYHLDGEGGFEDRFVFKVAPGALKTVHHLKRR